jgi:hypothetical protein
MDALASGGLGILEDLRGQSGPGIKDVTLPLGREDLEARPFVVAPGWLDELRARDQSVHPE